MVLDDVFLSCYFQLSLRCTWNVVDAIFKNLDNHIRKCMTLAGEIRTQGVPVLERMKRTSHPSNVEEDSERVISTWTMANGSLQVKLTVAKYYACLFWQIGSYTHLFTYDGHNLSTGIFRVALVIQHLFIRHTEWVTNKNHLDVWRAVRPVRQGNSYRLRFNNTICDTPEECDRVLDAVLARRQ